MGSMWEVDEVEIRTSGRRSKLTQDLQQRICAFIRAGAYDYVAAEAAGISRHTFFEWIRRGEGNDAERPATPLYAQFANAIRLAKAEARETAEVTIKKIDPKWWLARMHRGQPDAPGWMPTNAKQESTQPPSFVITRYSDQPSEKDGR
jgi:hypothetical protein